MPMQRTYGTKYMTLVMGDVNGVKVCSAQLAVAGRCGGGGGGVIWRTSVLQPSPASSSVSRSPGISSWVSPSLPLAQVTTRTRKIFTKPINFSHLRRMEMFMRTLSMNISAQLEITPKSSGSNRQLQVEIVIIKKLDASFKVSLICQLVIIYLQNKELKWGIHYLFFMYQKDKDNNSSCLCKRKTSRLLCKKRSPSEFLLILKEDMLQPHEKLTFNFKRIRN